MFAWGFIVAQGVIVVAISTMYVPSTDIANAVLGVFIAADVLAVATYNFLAEPKR